MANYTIRIDDRGRRVLLNALKIIKNVTENSILEESFSQQKIKEHEELLQLHRGILYMRPDPEVEMEEPVVGPDAGINQPRFDVDMAQG